jgi:hypothetical protein
LYHCAYLRVLLLHIYRKWVLDQKLHPDEPIKVEAMYRQLNPIRRLYRWPWDTLFEVFLEPRFVSIVRLCTHIVTTVGHIHRSAHSSSCTEAYDGICVNMYGMVSHEI